MEQKAKMIEQTEKLLAALDARSRDIIARRFGLNGGKRETLEDIGKEYGITRERVRQIESHTKKTLASLREQVSEIAMAIEAIFSEHGGVMAELHITQTIEADANVVHFYLHVLPEYDYVTTNELFHPHWHHQKHEHAHADEIVTTAREILDSRKTPITEEELVSLIQSKLQQLGNLPTSRIVAALIASKDIERTVFRQWGLADWAEVSPRGVGDKAYAVLRRGGKPTHFREIARLISEAEFDSKQANPQTVHNELIKDERFVLVGRGLYGLKEWGYMPGTVADVLEAILRKVGHSMSRDELVEEVLKQRIVKKNTILLGLQNSKRFARDSNNKYQLR